MGELELSKMFVEMRSARKEVTPADYWEKMSMVNMEQLDLQGIGNFKRTVAMNYFTWSGADGQIGWLMRHLGWKDQIIAFSDALENVIARALTFNRTYLRYTILTCLLWRYAEKNGADKVLNKLHEPKYGNPIYVALDGKLVTQDLANSALEYLSINDGVLIDRNTTIMELGAGYGRNAYVFLSLHPEIRYIIVDIPPALAVAQDYVSYVFPKRRIFKFRRFKNFARVKKEFNNSQVLFLTPSQLEKLPDKCADLFINISSFQEMPLYQIRYYFNEIDRLTKGHFYTKQWKCGCVEFDGKVITQKDYPKKKNWKKLYARECQVQDKFFEAMFKI